MRRKSAAERELCVLYHAGEGQARVSINCGQDIALLAFEVTDDRINAKQESRLRFFHEFCDAFLLSGSSSLGSRILRSLRIGIQSTTLDDLLNLQGRDRDAELLTVQDHEFDF